MEADSDSRDSFEAEMEAELEARSKKAEKDSGLKGEYDKIYFDSDDEEQKEHKKVN